MLPCPVWLPSSATSGMTLRAGIVLSLDIRGLSTPACNPGLYSSELLLCLICMQPADILNPIVHRHRYDKKYN